ncbi:hypothetical protein DP59_3086 [Burkholderia pseudomallei]|nr:hypothetical protein DP59_3086 [Burkholderia pseudomallei]
MPNSFAGRCLERTGTTKRRESCFVLQTLRVVASYCDKYRSGIRADAESLPQPRGVLMCELLQHCIEGLQLVFQGNPPLGQQAKRGRKCLQHWSIAQ